MFYPFIESSWYSSNVMLFRSNKFFDFLENIYVFFTVSSQRHDLLTQKLKQSVSDSKNRVIIPKRVSTTRWASRAEAVESVCKGFEVYKDKVQELSDENYEARSLHKVLNKLETGIYVMFWNDILNIVTLTHTYNN